MNLSLMDYDPSDPTDQLGDAERFINAVSEITEPPDDPSAGRGVHHNPVYHLKRYVDGVDRADLVAQGILPGYCDLFVCEPDNGQRVAVTLDLGGFDQELFDVHILAGSSGREETLTELAAFQSINLSELEQLSWVLDEGTTFRLLAASTAGGDLDVILATGDPFDPSNRGVASLPGEHPTSLQLVTDSEGGFVTLTPATLRATLLKLSDLTGNGFVDFEDLTILLANWNNNVSAAEGNLVNPDGTPVDFQDLTVLLADWTGPEPARSPEAVLGAEGVPEPSSMVLAVLAALGLNVCWRRRKRPTA